MTRKRILHPQLGALEWDYSDSVSLKLSGDFFGGTQSVEIPGKGRWIGNLEFRGSKPVRLTLDGYLDIEDLPSRQACQTCARLAGLTVRLKKTAASALVKTANSWKATQRELSVAGVAEALRFDSVFVEKSGHAIIYLKGEKLFPGHLCTVSLSPKGKIGTVDLVG
ncbi:MAG: hypothetical protein FD161_1342 [Limisphaerales bacterium]|nr:MAG: hypothetical protein FD161_1342 [Limisphaerales bacterium]KAG0509419.1 MAG: hypothetical protein E1N63_1261 [Limisphaerales bacterium]TXT52256.1 MAG: hypothetical protein FD140_743 [Limisphaerales bacterium]